MTQSITAAGLGLVKEQEGFRAIPAPLPWGDWVVGYGHVRVGEAGAAMSRDEAAHCLALDLAPFEKLVNEAVTKPLWQSQFDALVSFAFSLGAEAFLTSQVLRRVNAGQFLAAACAMDAWRKSDAAGELEIMGALVRRRAAEKAMFLSEVPCDAAPSALLRAKLDHAASVLGAAIEFGAVPAFPVIAAPPPKPAPAHRLREILMSEPATEVLLLTQVVPDDFADEIATAHATPVPRLFEGADREARSAFEMPRLNAATLVDNAGLVALMLFGVGLLAIGGSMLLGGRGDAIDLGAGAAIATPGLAAALMAGYGFARGRQLEPVRV